jgi:hypothetical protein
LLINAVKKRADARHASPKVDIQATGYLSQGSAISEEARSGGRVRRAV